jgi:PAS domain S-box-containing protein
MKPDKPGRALRLRILVGGSLLVCAFVGSAAYDSWRLHQQIMAANNRELSNLTHALGEEATRSLQAVDVVLRDTAAWYEATPSASPESVSTMLKLRAAGVPQISVLSIVDAHGMQRFRSRTTDEPLADVSDRPYFIVQRDHRTAGLFVNAPIVTRTEGLSAIVLSRRLSDRDGRFEGVITAIVTVEQLQTAYSAIKLGKDSALLLTSADGTIVAREPRSGGGAGSFKFPVLVSLLKGAAIDRVVSPMDGRTKLVSAIGVGDQSLILAVTRDEEQVLQPWYDELSSATIRTVLICALISITIAGLLRQLGRLERGEAALRKSEERYAMAMEAANEGHAEWNVQQDRLFASDKWHALHGLSNEAGVATSDDLRRLVVLHPDDSDAVKAALEDHIGGRTPAIEIDYRVRHANEEWRWIHARGRCLLDDDGMPLRLFCSAIDISERKNAESDRTRLEARLQQTKRLEALGTLAGGIAHDFNNILGAILGFGEMAQQRADGGSALRRHIDQVMQAGARARLLVKKILDFSRSGLTERQPVRFQSVVEEVVGMITPSLATGLSLQARLQTGDAAVIGDPTELYQVAMNLCSNAAQAVGDDGVIKISLERRHLAAPRSFLQGDLDAGNYVCLEVADTGPGIEPAVLPLIFDPFFTTKRVGEGTGLGLSVVHGIVSDLGGAIDVESGKTQGTVVSIWLPIAGELMRQSSTDLTDCPVGNGETVMIVDDERALVELAEELLAGLGYEPVGFESSEAALRAFEAEPLRFDVVISDEALPGMRGSELASRLLSLRPSLPIVLMSGNLGEAAEKSARDNGVSATLHKPLSLRQLATCLATVVRPAAELPD